MGDAVDAVWAVSSELDEVVEDSGVCVVLRVIFRVRFGVCVVLVVVFAVYSEECVVLLVVVFAVYFGESGGDAGVPGDAVVNAPEYCVSSAAVSGDFQELDEFGEANSH